MWPQLRGARLRTEPRWEQSRGMRLCLGSVAPWGCFAKGPLHESKSPWPTGWLLGWNWMAHMGVRQPAASPSLGFPGCRMGHAAASLSRGMYPERMPLSPALLSSFLLRFIYFGVCWVFIAAQAFLQLQQAGAPLWSQCTGFSLRGPLGAEHRLWGPSPSVVAAPRLWSTGSVAVVHGLSCSPACEIFPDEGSNPCPLHWQGDSLPLSHQGREPTCCPLNRAGDTVACSCNHGR